jgi:glycosyltransferase involved in cell wall biosynthesis
MSRPWPKITVVTPSFNQAAYLQETIESVLNQDYPNLEYIVLDGGSTDGSIDILKKYEKYFAYWRTHPDDGQSAAIIEGFQKSTGDILCWLNSDDFLAPGALALVGEYFQEHPEAEFLVGEVCIVNDKGERRHYLSEPKWDTNWQFMFETVFRSLQLSGDVLFI